MLSPITAANVELQMALQEIIAISATILKSNIFNPIFDGEKIKYMENVYKEAMDYRSQLQKVNNRLNIELFDKINGFLINQHKMLQRNVGFFNNLFNNPGTHQIATALIPILRNYFLQTEKAIEQFNVLKQATMSKLHALDDSEILQDTRDKIQHAERGLNNILTCLIDIQKELRAINNLANFPSQQADIKHQKAAKPSSKSPTVKFTKFPAEKPKHEHAKKDDYRKGSKYIKNNKKPPNM